VNTLPASGRLSRNHLDHIGHELRQKLAPFTDADGQLLVDTEVVIEEGATVSEEEASIVGLDVIRVAPCGRRVNDAWRHCDSPFVRLAYHSTKSKKLILRCPWCRGRRGHPSAAEIAALKQFVKTYGWNQRQIVIGNDGVACVQ
jgi:hypothetical protein